jgi:O-glycosyl hydrolase
MKSNDNFDNTNNVGQLLPSSYSAYANYFVKFLRGYAKAKVPVAAITPQNEPGQGTWYPGLNLPESAEASFVADYLKPALRSARLKTAIFGYDSSWSNPSYVTGLLQSPAGPALNGIAYHCYTGTPTTMSALYRQMPGLQQWVTECTTQIHPKWFPAELEIASLRNWASAVDTWNLALDPAGGPVQAPNTACQGCTGLVTVDESKHQVSYNNGYYQQVPQAGRGADRLQPLCPILTGRSRDGARRRRISQPGRHRRAPGLQQLDRSGSVRGRLAPQIVLLCPPGGGDRDFRMEREMSMRSTTRFAQRISTRS